jgi:nucleoside-diphosphate-sugar epimerase
MAWRSFAWTMICRMRILVIGGTMFMGREIVRLLVARGHDVSVLHRGDRHDLGPEVRNLQADRGDLPKTSALVTQGRFEAVFDLAYDWQAGTTAAHVEAVAQSCGDRLQRYVFISSIAAYGPGLDRRESDPLVPEGFPNPYAVHKATTERMLFSRHAESGFPVTTFRPPFVHGPRQPFYREQFFWDRLLDRRPIVLPDGGESVTGWAYVSDVAEGCVRAMEVPEAAGEAFNIGHVERPTQREFVELLARVAGVEATLVPVSREKIATAGGHFAAAGRLYFGEYIDLPPHTSIVDKARLVLGLTPTPIEDAFRRGFSWYQTQPRRPIDYTLEDRIFAS